MTRNQLQYWANKEIERSNRRNELETQRSNMVREAETRRSNKTKEIETGRHNRVTEAETQRHNMKAERVDTANAITGGIRNVATAFKDSTQGVANVAGSFIPTATVPVF